MNHRGRWWVGVWIVLLGIMSPLPSGGARAAPRMFLDQCTGFDGEALRSALALEMQAAPLLLERNDLKLLVECPDAITSQLTVERRDGAPPQLRILDLGDVPSAMRVKLLAVAAVELLESAAAVAPAVAPPVPMLAPPRPTEVKVTARALPEQTRRWRPRAIEMGSRGGARLYRNQRTAMAMLSAAVSRHELELGVSGQAGFVRADLGTSDMGVAQSAQIRLFVAAATIGMRVACWRGFHGGLCVQGRVAGGAALARADSPYPWLQATNVVAPFGEGALAFEALRRTGIGDAALWLELGWAEGLVARSLGESVAELDGAFASIGMAIRWGR
jgi:hypothetical protein